MYLFTRVSTHLRVITMCAHGYGFVFKNKLITKCVYFSWHAGFFNTAIGDL